MLHVNYYPFELAFQYPFTTAKGTKTHQPTLIVSLGLGKLAGYGEAPAISYYNVSVEGMIELLESKMNVISRYALTDPQRFWHFLHHLIPGEHFLTAALDIAGWDLFSQLNRKPLYKLLGLNRTSVPVTDYTIGIGTVREMIGKIDAHPWPVYKIKMASTDEIDVIRQLRAHSAARFRIDANEGWKFDDAVRILQELQQLGVDLIEQPLHRSETDAMKELKALSPLPLFADESCITEDDVSRCAATFDGINIKLTKCGGITPALRMITEARKTGLKVMMGSMCESTVGTAAIAHLMPLLDEVDADGPLLLKEDVAEGVRYDKGNVHINDIPGLGTRFMGRKFEK